MKLNIDRSDWKKVKLGDVATAPSIRINNPSESGFDHFIGNANIGQWDFRLTSWEPTDSVTSAMKGFETGDYLFVRRSLYASDFRERSPRASFPGVCSGDIITIRENPEKIANGFLIGVLNSPAIWKYVVANASGSITRRIKWRDLANYEFLLPPKDQQAKLAELLWAADAVVEKVDELSSSQTTTRRALLKEVFSNSDNAVPIGEVVKLSSGKSRPKNLADEPLNEHIYPVYGGNGIIGYTTSPNVNEPTIILGRVGEYCGVVHDSHEPSWISDNALYVKEWKQPIDHTYVSRFLEFIDLNKQQTGGGQPLITQSLVCKNSISIPSSVRITEDVKRINLIESNQRQIKQQSTSSKQLLKSLINQIF